MYKLTLNLLFHFLIVCTAFAQGEKPCDELDSNEGIERFYKVHLCQGGAAITRDHCWIHFEEIDSIKVTAFVNWAKGIGYSVDTATRSSVYHKEDGKGVPAFFVILTLPVKNSDLAQFSKVVKSISEQKQALGIENCGGRYAK